MASAAHRCRNAAARACPTFHQHGAGPALRLQHNALIAAGQWWRLLTPAFLHADFIHLAVNSASLNNLGPLVESTAG